MKQRSEMRTLTLEGDAVAYRTTSGGWQLPINRITAIGEATTPNGPIVDDYWLCFVAGRDGTWYEASFYTSGREDVLQALSKRLGTSLALGLCNSTEYRSRV